MISRINSIRLFFVTCMVILSFGCSGGGSSSQNLSSVNTGGTPGSTTTGVGGSLVITNSSLALNENTTVTVTFKKADGTPASGVTASFTTTIGTISPGSSVTNSDGVATATLLAGTTSGQGQIVVTAYYDGKTNSTTGNFQIGLPRLTLSPITFGLSSLSYGGSTSVSVTVKDANGATYTTSEVDVVFSSTQTALGFATINTPVRTVNGVATTTYQAKSFSGTDTVTATITDSTVTSALTVNPLSASSITFVSASPANIGLKGMGGTGIQETSTVTFKVLDTAGQPKANQQVDFTLNTSVGGLALTSASGSTATDGTVSTIVQAGVVATSVRVTAKLRDASPEIATQSDQLVVSTGVPAQDGFSISIENLNPESWNIDGVVDIVTARLSDHFHNPVPDGTAVYFTTSGGSIEPSCTTVNGVCSVNWTSQNPRPSNGRARILAYAVGEEAFLDANGNGLADVGEFVDDSEAFRDDDENGLRGTTTETFIDFNSDGSFNGSDGKYNGVLQGTASVGAPKSKHVFSNTTIIMASSQPGTVVFFTDSNSNGVYDSSSDTNLGSTFAINPNNPVIKMLNVSDLNGNPLPSGYVVNLSGKSTDRFIVPNTSLIGNNSTVFPVSFNAGGTSPDSSSVAVKVYKSISAADPIATYYFTVTW